MIPDYGKIESRIRWGAILNIHRSTDLPATVIIGTAVRKSSQRETKTFGLSFGL